MPPFGLSLYRLTARKRAVTAAGWPERPRGRLIWLHAGDDDLAAPLTELGHRIVDEDGHAVLLTGGAVSDRLICQPMPPDTPTDAVAMLDHWRPDALLFAGGEIRPALIHAAAERGIPMTLAEARAPHLPQGREGWYPGLLKASLGRMQEILAVDDTAARALRKAGVSDGLVIAGRMEQPSAALPCNEAERAVLANLMNTRPVWLAAALPQAEESAVIEAHRAGLRHAHRLLLILVPDDSRRAEDLARRMEAEDGWQVACRLKDEEPDPETEVYIADTSELGLWYRLAPITFLGGSLSGTGSQRDPMEAAALGSSLIHGPRPGVYGTTFGRLGAARAARSVASGSDLAEALSELLAPDRAARLAQAAWAVASDGVEVTDHVHRQVRRMLGEA